MVRVYRRPLSDKSVPKCVRRVGNLTTDFARRLAARRLPWSRLSAEQRAIALRVIIEGRSVYA